MLRSYRLVVIAALALALSCPVTEAAHAQRGTAEDQSDRSAQPFASDDIENQLGRIAGALEAAQANPVADAEEKRAKDDLQAQQDMARYALWMFFATALTAFLTAAGVLLIWRTLIHTRRASVYAGLGARQARRAADASDRMAEEAARATMAAVEASAEGRRAADAAHQANRPWLELKIAPGGPLEVNARGVSLRSVVTVRNRGRSPATNVLVITQLAAQSLEGDVIYKNLAVRKVAEVLENLRVHDRTTGITVFPDSEDVQNHGTSLSPEELNASRLDSNAPLLISLAVAVRYRFGEQTAETVESFSVLEAVGPEMNFDTSQHREIWPLRFDNCFSGYAT